ncbi:MAG: alanine racemase [Methylotenera sp.]
MRPIVASISHSALRHNLSVVKQLAPRSKVMAVVKANGYGHGLLNVAQGLAAADGFAVLGMSEAVMLRGAGFKQTLLLLEGVFCADELQEADQYDVDIEVHGLPQLQMQLYANLDKPVQVHLKKNTGMNRLGFTPEDYLDAFHALKASKNVAGITLMTHFATADKDPGIDAPLSLFRNTIAGLKQPVSLANSAAILRHPGAHADWIRPGIMLYGASTVSGLPAADFGLKPVMRFSSEIIAVQEIKAGDGLGYGHRFIADKTMRIGVVACGYADGYPRHAGLVDGLAHGAPIAVCGKITTTLGRVSMDMLFCDLTHIAEANIGSPVELWGQQVPVDAVAEASDTVGYELLCAVSSRVTIKVVE